MKTKKLLSILFVALLLCVILALTACHTSTGPTSGEKEAQESENESSNNESSQQGEGEETEEEDSMEENKKEEISEEPDEMAPTGDFGYRLSSISQAMAVTDKGYYYIANKVLYFYDKANDISIPMCSRTNCTHATKRCDGYIYRSGPDSFSANCDGYKMFYYNDKLYMVERTDENDIYLCRYDASYNDKERMVLLTSYAEEKKVISNSGAYTVLDGYFYYYTYVYESTEETKGNYVVEMNCMKVKMKKGATPEKVGSFQYAGDTQFSVSDTNGTTVITDGKNIYYVGGYFSRLFTTEDTMAYIIAKYSVDTNEFTILDSYVGERDSNAWGDGIGLILCGDKYVCMAEDGTMYATTYEDGIVAINFETNVRKKIYTSPYSIQYREVVYDGKYLYFIETQKGVATYLTVIDTAGNLIRRYEFEYTDSYQLMMEKTPNKGKISGEITLLGVANDNILVTSTSYVYKNLSGYYVTGETTTINYGVGLINKSDFLANREVEIKQIYQR